MIGAGFGGSGRVGVEEEEEFQFIGSPAPQLAEPLSPETPAIAPVAAGAKRLLVFHYHIFKNAGSSFDETLKQSFGDLWAEQEFDHRDNVSNADAVEAYLRANPQLKAVSSHTAVMPVPDIAGVEIFPVLFVRHPILRLKSAYRFERTQGADTIGSQLASRTDFKGYIEGLLEPPTYRQARDFQTYRLAFGDTTGKTEAERAFRTIGRLPFLGLVEAYDESLRRLDALLLPYTDDFRPAFVRVNATEDRDDLSIAEQLAEIRAELGDDLYIRLEANNLTDLRIFDMLAARYGLPALPSGDWIAQG